MSKKAWTIIILAVVIPILFVGDIYLSWWFGTKLLMGSLGFGKEGAYTVGLLGFAVLVAVEIGIAGTVYQEESA